ncbi:MAG: TatD family hydrolase [Planctomycetota bacterium]|jgi:TatD DNase family protein
MPQPWKKLTRLIADTHCHVLDYEDPGAVIQEIGDNNLTVHAVTTSPDQFDACVGHSRNTPGIFPSLGLFPTEAVKHADNMEAFFNRLDQTRFVGEVGLDYVTQDKDERQTQRRVFEAILSRCAESGDKVLTIHSRRAAGDVIAAIGHDYPGATILHWFSGTPDELNAAQACGPSVYFSVNPAMIRSASGKKLIGAMGPDRVLTETDGPYVTTGKDGAPATPLAIRGVIESLGHVWECSLEEAAQRVHENYRRATGPAVPDKNP